MSGHSKWATIHRQKEVKDAKKGAVFTKLAAAITVAVRQGGGITDPNQNFRLRLVVDKARQFNMPKENINRAIEKGSGHGEGVQLNEAVFEGFLPGGAAVMIEALTDNKLRTAQSLRGILDKGGGTLGSSGAVAHLFSQLGVLQIKNQSQPGKNRDEQELELIDLGAREIEEVPEGFVIYCDRDKTYEVKQKLEAAGYEVISAELVMVPQSGVVLAPGVRERAEQLIDRLEEIDEVTNVWSNYQISNS